MRLLILLLCLAPQLALAEHPMLHHSGLPIPRFVTLKSSEINFRVGPGKDYPISWVYHRKGLPVEVIQEYGHWRKLRDKDQVEGWVHSQLISGARSVIILGSKEHQLIPIYLAPTTTSRQVMEAEPAAMLALNACKPNWCAVQTADEEKGWVEKRFLWGVYKKETFED